MRASRGDDTAERPLLRSARRRFIVVGQAVEVRCTLSGVVNRSMTRRSAGVNSERAGVPATPGEPLEECHAGREDGRRCPVGAGVDVDDAAVCVNEVVRRLCMTSLPRMTLTPNFAATRSVVTRSPVSQVQIAGSASCLAAKSASTFGVSCSGSKEIDTSLRRPFSAASARAALDRCRIPIHCRAEVGQWTLRVDECNQHRRALPVGQGSSPIGLVDQCGIGNLIANRENAFGHRRAVVVRQRRIARRREPRCGRPAGPPELP